MSIDRSRTLTRRTALLLTTGAAASSVFAETPAPEPADDTAAGANGIKLGVCTYSLREFSRSLALKMIRELSVSYVSVKDVHLAYTLNPSDMEKAKAELQDAHDELEGRVRERTEQLKIQIAARKESELQ